MCVRGPYLFYATHIAMHCFCSKHPKKGHFENHRCYLYCISVALAFVSRALSALLLLLPLGRRLLLGLLCLCQ